MHQRKFPYAPSWESAVALITEWWARSHIWQPLAGKSPAQPPPSPAPLWSGLDRDLSLAFTPPEKTKMIQNQNTEGRSVFHLGAEQRLHMLLLKGFSAPICNTAFINYQLISDKYSDLPLNLWSSVAGQWHLFNKWLIRMVMSLWFPFFPHAFLSSAIPLFPSAQPGLWVTQLLGLNKGAVWESSSPACRDNAKS